RELVGALDEEVNRLPERYRAPLVLCHLEGRTRDEAARELGWSLATLKRRLEQGRDLLRAGLARRGLALPGALLAAALTQAATAAVPAPLAGATVRAAVEGVARGGAALSGLLTARPRLTATLLFAGVCAAGLALGARALSPDEPAPKPVAQAGEK